VPEPEAASGELTLLLRAAAAGDASAEERVFALAYDELRRIARSALRRESAATLEPTALVHEAYLRLGNRHEIAWADRRHFYGVAARAMRRVLVDRARARRRLKRAQPLVTLPDGLANPGAGNDVVLAVDEALHALAAVDPRRAQVVELRWFAGLAVEEVADLLEVGTATVKRDWAAAKAWLTHHLASELGHDPYRDTSTH
jgi:RNA polymerase sigma factor (TIGR02999 family)